MPPVLRQGRWSATIFLPLILLALVVVTASALVMAPENAAASQDPSPLQQLLADTGGSAEVSVDPATGVASFVRLPAGEELNLAGEAALDDPAGTANEDARQALALQAGAAAFFNQYGGVFGVTDFAEELALEETSVDDVGYTHLTYRQVYRGQEVFAGQLTVHFNQAGELSAVNGTFIPDIDLNTSPTLSALTAENEALNFVASKNELAKLSGGLTASGSQLLVFRQGLIQGVPGSNHLAYEVTVVDALGAIREVVYVDAHDGRVLDHYAGIHQGLYRKIYERSISASRLKWEEGDSFPTGDTDWDNEILGAGESYNLFMSLAGWDSYDNNGSEMLTVNDPQGWFCPIAPNASWNSVSTNYCPGVTGDDTVAHEWGHAYTEYTHNLVYAWQSGALNESYSDIWGEVVDFLNGRGTDSPIGQRSPGGSACSIYGSGSPSTDNSYRWLSGEDDPAFGGAIRDLWQPACYGDPDKVSASQYFCSTADGGGVHTNSGVPNRAFALTVDGDTSLSIIGIGLTKAAHIYWRAAANYQSAATDFVEHAAALRSACSDLVGINLPALSTTNPNPGLSGESITTADCNELDKAIAAVELETVPSCTFQPLLDPNAPALCSEGETVNTIHLETWSTGSLPAGWSVGTRNAAAGFDVPQWSIASDLPDGRSGNAAFGSDPNTACISDATGVNYLDSPSIPIPGGVTTPYLTFEHWVATEDGYDGGNIKISVDGGAFNLIPSSAFSFNAYNGNLLSTSQSSNPIAGESAFNGSDGGTNSGSWVRSIINLSGLASAGDSIVLRFEMGTDYCSGKVGWYLDDIQTYSCESGAPTPTLTNTPTATATNTPTATATATEAPPTNTPTSTATSTPTATNTATATATNTPTATDVPPTSTPTNTPTATATEVPPTSTPTLTPTATPTAPAVPTLLSPADGAMSGDDTPTFDWSPVAGAVEYQLQVDNNSDFSSPELNVLPGVSSHTPVSGLADDSYSWRVRAKNGSGQWGEWSSPWTLTIKTTYFTYLPFAIKTP